MGQNEPNLSGAAAALRRRVEVAAGREPADLVLRGGRIVNVFSHEIIEADVAIAGEHIAGIGRYDGVRVQELRGQYVCPGFIDAHVHIESSMLSVPQYARLVAPRGTAAVVIDPHEIGNVLGVEGIRYMRRGAAGAPLDVYLMVSSCVPASHFESAAATLDAGAIRPLLDDDGVLGLAEMMNYPGVVAGAADCLEKIAAVRHGRLDGHAPGLSGRPLCAYVATGIASDHECTSQAEAREKLRLGMHILIREGSQARNLDELLPLVTPDTLSRFMFCTDDCDVDDLITHGHIDHVVRRAAGRGMNPIHAIRIATLSAADYFGLRELGAVAPGRLASLAVLDDLASLRVTRSFHRGRDAGPGPGGAGQPAQASAEPRHRADSSVVNTVRLAPLTADALRISAPPGQATQRVRVMIVRDDRIDTIQTTESLAVRDGALHADASRDLAKIATIERHRATGRLGLGFVRGFGLQRGAIASTVGHDAHNLVAAGMSDAAIQRAAAHLAQLGGGFCVATDDRILADVPLPIAGLMSDVDAATLSGQLRRLHAAAHEIGCVLRRPFMALSFLTLSVIGELKVTDQGLVDVGRFEIVPVICGPG